MAPKLPPKVNGYPRGPDGSLLTPANLPSPDTLRWVVRRKAEVVYAVEGGLLTVDEACTRYRLTLEEYAAWKSAVIKHGVAGLRTTRSQVYRKTA